jgi:hypothetical protein
MAWLRSRDGRRLVNLDFALSMALRDDGEVDVVVGSNGYAEQHVLPGDRVRRWLQTFQRLEPGDWPEPIPAPASEPPIGEAP